MSCENRLLRLIRAYTVAVDGAVNVALRRVFPEPFRAWEERQIPSKGKFPKSKFPSYRSVTFHFRGHGCVVHWVNRVEFDFGPGGRHDGFTAYHLYRYVHLNKVLRRRFGDLDIYGGMTHLEQAGLIFQPAWEPTPFLFYLTDKGKEAAAKAF